MTSDYYQALGVKPDATVKQIRDAYRNLAFRYHPDRNRGKPESAEMMKRINEAYAVLSNPEKRREYDVLRTSFGPSAHDRFRETHNERDIFRDSDILHIFEEMTKTFGFRSSEEVFRDFYGQGYRTFEFRRPGFSMRGFVYSWPPKRPAKRREEIDSGLGAGRLSRFILRKITGIELPEAGDDLEDTIELPVEHARKGGPYAYLHPKKGTKIVVKVPPGIRDGQRVRLAGLGAEGKGGANPGDLYLKVRVRKPLLEKAKDFISGLFK
jgi:DnaJ-class molecular chaperone